MPIRSQQGHCQLAVVPWTVDLLAKLFCFLETPAKSFLKQMAKCTKKTSIQNCMRSLGICSLMWKNSKYRQRLMEVITWCPSLDMLAVAGNNGTESILTKVEEETTAFAVPTLVNPTDQILYFIRAKP